MGNSPRSYIRRRAVLHITRFGHCPIEKPWRQLRPEFSNALWLLILHDDCRFHILPPLTAISRLKGGNHAVLATQHRCGCSALSANVYWMRPENGNAKRHEHHLSWRFQQRTWHQRSRAKSTGATGTPEQSEQCPIEFRDKVAVGSHLPISSAISPLPSARQGPHLTKKVAE
jgi:hypothetical protein